MQKSIIFESQIYTSVAGSPYKLFDLKIDFNGYIYLENTQGKLSMNIKIADLANTKIITDQKNQKQLTTIAMKLTINDMKTEVESVKVLDNVPLCFAVATQNPNQKDILQALLCISDFVKETPVSFLKDTLSDRLLELFQNNSVVLSKLQLNKEIAIDPNAYLIPLDKSSQENRIDKNSEFYGMPTKSYSADIGKGNITPMNFTPIYTTTTEESNVMQPRWDQSYTGNNAIMETLQIFPPLVGEETPEFKKEFDAFCTEAILPDIPGKKEKDDDNQEMDNGDLNYEYYNGISLGSYKSNNDEDYVAPVKDKKVETPSDFDSMTFEFAGGKYNLNEQKSLPCIIETDIESTGVYATAGENYGDILNISASKLSFYKNYRLLIDEGYPKNGIPVATGSQSIPVCACNVKLVGSYAWVIGMDNGCLQVITPNKVLLEKLNFTAFFKKYPEPLDQAKFFTKIMGVDLKNLSIKRIYLNHQVKHSQLQIIDLLQIDSNIVVLMSSPADKCSFVALVDSFDLVNKQSYSQNIYGKSCMKIEGRLATHLIPLATCRISKTNKKSAFGIVEKTGNVIVIGYNFSTEFADNEKWNADQTYKRLEFICNFKEFIGIQNVACNEMAKRSPIIPVRTNKYNEFFLCAVTSKSVIQIVKYQMGTYDAPIPNSRSMTRKLCFSVKSSAKGSLVDVIELAAAMLESDPINQKKNPAERLTIEIPKANDEACTSFNIIEVNHNGLAFQPPPLSFPQLTEHLYDDEDLVRNEVLERAKNMGVYMSEEEDETLDSSPVICFTTKDNVLIVGVLQSDINNIHWEICDLRKRFSNLSREFSVKQIMQSNDGILLYVQGPGNNKLLKMILKCKKLIETD